MLRFVFILSKRKKERASAKGRGYVLRKKTKQEKKKEEFGKSQVVAAEKSVNSHNPIDECTFYIWKMKKKMWTHSHSFYRLRWKHKKQPNSYNEDQ